MPPTSIYSPLKHENEIRLLRIGPKSGGRCVKITLETYRLDSDVQFTALSYVWGNPTPQFKIVCNGHRVPIGQNLLVVLSRLQVQGYNDLLWVDAICINQNNNKEKSIQVGMMRNIYSQASDVIFWLGEEQNYDKEGVRLMNAFFKNHYDHSDLEELRAKPLHELGLSLHDRGWLGWISIFSRPWFGRVWVVQEFLNAKQSTFMSGALVIPTKLLVYCGLAAGICSAINGVLAFHIGDICTAKDIISKPLALSIDQFCREKAGDEDVRIVDLWTRSQLLEATDPRDRVFALLSTQKMVSLGIIDYNKNDKTVYMEIARIALTLPVAETDWYTLRFSEFGPYRDRTNFERASRFLACRTRTPHSSDLPSWVPDWRSPGFRFVPLTRYYPGVAWFTHKYHHATFQANALLISGIIVDKPRLIIESTPYMEIQRTNIPLENFARKGSRESWGKRMLDWQIMCYLGASWGISRSAKHQLLELFCRAMAFGALPKRSAAPGTEYIAGFQSLHKKLVCMSRKTVSYSLEFSQCLTAPESAVIYESVFEELSSGRKFCITENGSMAWVPMDTNLGDYICFLAGCAVPFVVRPANKSFELIGDCYFQRMMCDASITLESKPQLFEIR